MRQVFALFMSIIVILSGAQAFAQAPKTYIRSDGQFVANGNEYPRGFWIPVVNDAEEVFRYSPEATKEYKDHLRMGQWFGILNWGALGVFTTYTIVALADDSYDGGTALALFAVPWAFGVYFGMKSNQHLVKAMNIVNGVPADQARFLRLPQTQALKVPLLAWTF